MSIKGNVVVGIALSCVLGLGGAVATGLLANDAVAKMSSAASQDVDAYVDDVLAEYEAAARERIAKAKQSEGSSGKPSDAATSSETDSASATDVSSDAEDSMQSVDNDDTTADDASSGVESAPDSGEVEITDEHPSQEDIDRNEMLASSEELYLDTNREWVYIVKPWDTLSSLSNKFGRSVDELAEYNHIENVHLIYDDSALRIPHD